MKADQKQKDDRVTITKTIRDIAFLAVLFHLPTKIVLTIQDMGIINTSPVHFSLHSEISERTRYPLDSTCFKN